MGSFALANLSACWLPRIGWSIGSKVPVVKLNFRSGMTRRFAGITPFKLSVKDLLKLNVLFFAMMLTLLPGLAEALDRLVVEKAGGGKVPFRVEIVDTPETRARGLMHRKAIAPDYGMLFHFQTAQPVAFWMKNTLIPLDMIFAGPDGKIHDIHHQAQPGDLTMRGSKKPTRGVLEVRGGLTDKLGIKVGDYLRHKIFR